METFSFPDVVSSDSVIVGTLPVEVLEVLSREVVTSDVAVLPVTPAEGFDTLELTPVRES
jgi:hypothetical protein